MTPLLTRKAATAFLINLGVPLSSNALAELATDGRGPSFAILNGRAVYREADLTAWVNAQFQSASAQSRGRSKRAPAGVAA